MNKFLTSFLAAAISLTAAATEPNRIIINHADGSTSAYMTDRITNMTFATVNGPVKAEVTVEYVDSDEHIVYATLTPTDDCNGWKNIIMPSNEIAQFDTDAKLAAYIDATMPFIVREFPNNGSFYMDEPLRPNIEYTFCTLGFDIYGAPCDISAATFIPEVPLTGKPDVSVTVADVTETSAKITMTPNKDCPSFAYYLDEKGKLQEYFEMLGSSGIGSLEEVVEMLSYEHPTTETVINPDWLRPSTEYELSIVCYDEKGIKSPLKTVAIRTQGGGISAAWVDITPDGYRINQMPNPDNIYETIFVPFAYFKFTPNENTARYRQEMFTKTDYEKLGKDAAIALVKREPAPDVPDEMWFRYTEKVMCSHFEPNTEIVVIAAGKNAIGEWGEANIFEYTTPSDVDH